MKMTAPTEASMSLLNALPVPPSKQERVVTWLLTHGSINRKEAEKPPIYDHCLNSTVSELRQRLELSLIGTREKHQGYGSKPTYYTRYRLTESGKKQAAELVELWRKRRGAPPLVLSRAA